MEPQPLSRTEAKSLLAACPNTTAGIRDKAVLVTLYRGGTRISATLRVRPSDIDWERKTLVIHDDKGGKGRTVVLDDGALDILKVWAERRTSIGINGHHVFFCATNEGARGNHLDSSHYRHLIKRLGKVAGIEKRCHLHGLRHTAASELLEEGFDLATIAGQLGHSYTSTTSRYLHRLRPDLMNSRLKEREW
jgi:site-specific recombinase XerD